ncbi:MAG: hypothetical protein LBQ01_09690 [Prevotellaceae bacterium]|nr:hypothetical protein [Prevotellaceae bacterium]
MKKLGYFYMLFLCIFSCKNDEEVILFHIDVSQATTLAPPETLYSFTDKFAFGVSIRDTVAFVMQAKSDTSLTAINIKTKSIIQSFGVSGMGPNDICDPIFISSIDHSDVLLQDGRVNKFHKVGFNRNLKRYSVDKFMIYPEKIWRSGESNISRNFISGRKVGRGEKMFYIYDRNNDTVMDIDYYPPIKNLNKELDFNNIYSPSVSLNEERNRIVIGMFFFDMFQIYDLSGNRLKTCCFSDNGIPMFNHSDGMETVMQKCETGLIRSFATKDYCYFLRIARDFSSGSTKFCMLIQIDWEGELINAYHIPDKVLGHFYIDEQNRKMYITRHRTVPDIHVNEVFEIVSYQLKEI